MIYETKVQHQNTEIKAKGTILVISGWTCKGASDQFFSFFCFLWSIRFFPMQLRFNFGRCVTVKIVMRAEGKRDRERRREKRREKEKEKKEKKKEVREKDKRGESHKDIVKDRTERKRRRERGKIEEE